jgi:hypothetical protein
MEGIFGVGPLEILLILILALVILGPQDMVKTARQLGRAVYRLYHSPIWRQLVSTQQELRDLPTKFVREAGLEETIAGLKKTGAEVKTELKEVANSATADLTAVQQDIKSESRAAREEALGMVAEIKAAPAAVPFQPAPADPEPAPIPPADPLESSETPALVDTPSPSDPLYPSSNGSDEFSI